jgi:hypothetical protein
VEYHRHGAAARTAARGQRKVRAPAFFPRSCGTVRFMPTGGGSSDSDDALEQVLREMLRNDPVPEAVLAQARAVGHTRPPADTELLDLVYDSRSDRAFCDVDADEPVRLLVFSGLSLCLAIRLDATSNETRLSGWTAPALVVEAQLRTEEHTSPLTVDQNGTIHTNGVVSALSSVVLQVDIQDEHRVFHTSWFVP